MADTTMSRIIAVARDLTERTKGTSRLVIKFVQIKELIDLWLTENGFEL